MIHFRIWGGFDFDSRIIQNVKEIIRNKAIFVDFLAESYLLYYPKMVFSYPIAL